MGKTFTLALTEKAELFSWGTNSFGELGLGTTLIKAALNPTKLQEFHNTMKHAQKNEFVVQIASAKYHSICLTSEGRIFTWGRNTGNPHGVEVSQLPLISSLDSNHVLKPSELK